MDYVEAGKERNFQIETSLFFKNSYLVRKQTSCHMKTGSSNVRGIEKKQEWNVFFFFFGSHCLNEHINSDRHIKDGSNEFGA